MKLRKSGQFFKKFIICPDKKRKTWTVEKLYGSRNGFTKKMYGS